MRDNIRMIGRLITEEEYNVLNLPHYFTRVFCDINANNTITLKPLSQLPHNFKEIKKVLCQCDRLDFKLNELDIYNVEKMVEGQIIVFRPYCGKNDCYAYDQCYLPKNAYPSHIDDEYVAVPCFDLRSLNMSEKVFHNAVSGGNSIPIEPAVSDEIEDRTDFIFVKIKNEDEEGYKIYLYFNIQGLIIRNKASKIYIPDPEHHRVEFNFVDVMGVIDDVKDHIVFTPRKIYNKYIDSYNNREKNTMGVNIHENSVISKRDASTITEDKILTEQIELHEVEFLPNTIEKEGVKVGNEDILQKMKDVANEKQLIYSDEDLINFYVSSKASNFIVLAGMSGTGKSKLVQVYAKALGINEYDGLKFVSVSPAWTDDSDVLGYVDYKNMLYREADTELLTFLRKAANDRNHKYIVCFDEMNLARVEHYFSQFLSILEDDEDERRLIVYNNALKGNLYNSLVYPESIKIYNNVLLVGTVNIDESTFNFSDKVLDRANIIKLGMRPFTELQSILKDCELTERELSCLTELHGIINKSNPKIGIGYRIIKQMNNYIKNIPDNEIYSRKLAFDKLLVQRVITKLRGSEEQIMGLIGKIDKDENLSSSDIVNLLEKYNDISEFVCVKNELKNKAKELSLYGYSV